MNLKELAAHLGLSVTTVSRALNGHAEVKSKTRARIIAEAARLNYSPSSAALRLATGRSGAFGLLLEVGRSLMREALFREFLVGLFDELSKSDSDLIIKPTKMDDGREYERFYARGQVDGFVLTRPMVDDPRVAYLQKKRIPFVLHGPAGPGVRYSYLTIDNGSVIRNLTNLLADLGHVRIALLNDHTNFSFARQRLEAFQNVVTERGLDPNPVLVREMRMDERNGYEAVRTLLGLDQIPTAVICGNVLIAEGAYRAIEDAGLAVGKDVSVIAHDDVCADMPAERFRPALTATEASLTAAGIRIAEFLLRLAGGERPEALQEIWQPQLIYRASAQPPGRG